MRVLKSLDNSLNMIDNKEERKMFEFFLKRRNEIKHKLASLKSIRNLEKEKRFNTRTPVNMKQNGNVNLNKFSGICVDFYNVMFDLGSAARKVNNSNLIKN